MSKIAAPDQSLFGEYYSYEKQNTNMSVDTDFITQSAYKYI